MEQKVYESLLNDYANIMGVKLNGEYDAELIQLKEKYNGKLKHNPSYYEYYRFFRSIIHKSDEKLFDAMFSSENIFGKIADGEKVTAIFHLKDKDGCYIPYQFEMIKYVGDEYECLFVWKLADKNNSLLENSLALLSSSYLRIMRVNLSSDSYEPVKIMDDPIKSTKYSAWIRDFCNYGNVFHEDVFEFLEFTKLSNLKSLFTKQTDDTQILRYRRRYADGSFRWTKLTITPSRDFTDENKIVVVYVTDIHDDYCHQESIARSERYYATHDPITGFYNKSGYEIKLTDLQVQESLGLVYITLNNVEIYKDQLILSDHLRKVVSLFRTTDCYRITRTEVIILVEDINEDTFEHKVKMLKDMHLEGVSIGSAWREKENISIVNMLNTAEDLIYNK